MSRRVSLLIVCLALMMTGMSCGQPDSTAPSIPVAGVDSDGGETYLVTIETSKGNIVIEVHPEWAPLGAARFKELLDIGFYDEARFFRVIPGFMVQFGMAADAEVHEQWGENNIKDDPVTQSNQTGYVTFAKTGLPNSRSTQLFINYGDNSQLDAQGFAPIGKVLEGMDVATTINPEYGEQPDQMMIKAQGNYYLKAMFPNLDYIKRAYVNGSDRDPGSGVSAADTAPAVDAAGEADSDSGSE